MKLDQLEICTPFENLNDRTWRDRTFLLANSDSAHKKLREITFLSQIANLCRPALLIRTARWFNRILHWKRQGPRSIRHFDRSRDAFVVSATDRNGSSAECYRRAYLGCAAIGRNDRDRMPRIAGRLTVIDIIAAQRPEGWVWVACGCAPKLMRLFGRIARIDTSSMLRIHWDPMCERCRRALHRIANTPLT